MGEMLRQLRQRKLVQWTLGYLAGAWVVVQVAALLGQQFQWDAAIQRAITVAAFGGVLPALIVAWYHGERGAQRLTGTEVLLLIGATALVLSAGMLAYKRTGSDAGDGEPRAAATALDEIAKARSALEDARAAPNNEVAIEALERALAGFERATASDPGSTRGWLGTVHAASQLSARAQDAAKRSDQARAAAARLDASAPASIEAGAARMIIARLVDVDREAVLAQARSTLAAPIDDEGLQTDLRVYAYNSGVELGRWDDVRELLASWLAITPEDPWLWGARGRLAFALGEWDLARRALDRAISISQPASVELHIQRAWVELAEDGDLQGWSERLRQIEPVYGTRSRWVYQAWHAALAAGEFDRALEVVERSRATDWAPHGKDDLLGETYFMMGDLGRARRVLTPVLEARELAAVKATDPGSRVWPLAALGQTRALMGDRAGAIASLDEALAALPARPRPVWFDRYHEYIGLWYGLAGAPDRATEVLREATAVPGYGSPPNTIWLHHTAGPLRSHAPFEALMRERGANTSRGYRPPAAP